VHLLEAEPDDAKKELVATRFYSLGCVKLTLLSANVGDSTSLKMASVFLKEEKIFATK